MKINTIGKEEEEAVLRVLRRGVLSGYVATQQNGGYEVQRLEEEWSKFFGTRYAVACNSATSGILAACMAAGVGPYDEVIVPYYTMSATAAAPAVLGATVVLGKIDEHYCLDPNDVSNLINENTKALIVTNMFGHPAQLKKLRMICDGAGIVMIEDNAQAIMATEDGEYTGTIGHMGVFSLNVHKHIQTGEGGVVVTNDPEFHNKLNGAINHGECRGSDRPGLNLRMTEVTAAIAREQLKKLPGLVQKRRETARLLIEKLGSWTNATPTRNGCEHSYYALPIKVNGGWERYSADVVRFINKAGIPCAVGYNGNLLINPMFNSRLDEERIKQLCDLRYQEVHKLLIIEICSEEITEEMIEELK